MQNSAILDVHNVVRPYWLGVEHTLLLVQPAMTSYRSRSKSPQRRRSDSPEQKGANKLPQNAEEISESDYFMKNDEFRAWLKEEKDRVRSFYLRQPVLQIEQSSSISMNCPERRLEGTSHVNVGLNQLNFGPEVTFVNSSK